MSIVCGEFAAAAGTQLALADPSRELDWTYVNRLLNQMGNALLAMTGRVPERVAVFAENSVETVIAHLAAISVGISTVPVNSHLTAREVSHLLNDSDAAVVFVGPETAERGVQAAQLATRQKVIGWRTDRHPAVHSWETWLSDSPTTDPPADMAPRPFLHYTSGTTGVPKGVLSPPAMFAGGKTVADHFAAMRDRMVLPEGPVLVVSPMYHTGPLGLIHALACGLPLILLKRFDPEAALQAIERYGVTSAAMVPTHFQRLLALPPDTRSRYDVSSLKLVAHTGSACPVDVKRRMLDWFGPVLYEGYGATEAGTTNSITAEEWLAHPGSVGRTRPPFELLVAGEQGELLPTGEVGQLYFRDSTGRGIEYHNDPGKTQAAHLAPGVFTLGDMGYVDADGYLYVTDRATDMVLSGGVNIYPAEIEQALLTHQDIEDAAVIGVPNDEMGEELKALVVLRHPRDDNSTADALAAYCRERLAGYKCPRSFEFVDDLGRNAMGKLDKRRLRAPFWPTARTIGGG